MFELCELFEPSGWLLMKNDQFKLQIFFCVVLHHNITQ